MRPREKEISIYLLFFGFLIFGLETYFGKGYFNNFYFRKTYSAKLFQHFPFCALLCTGTPDIAFFLQRVKRPLNRSYGF